MLLVCKLYATQKGFAAPEALLNVSVEHLTAETQ